VRTCHPAESGTLGGGAADAAPGSVAAKAASVKEM
jgi:hypothetical protein